MSQAAAAPPPAAGGSRVPPGYRGSQVPPGSPGTGHSVSARPPLVRSPHRVVAGIAAGLADHLGVDPRATRVFFVVSGLVAGIGVLFYLVLWILMPSEAAQELKETAAERRARDQERARISAHLHDSVLQTLALIQSRAGASSEVGRIARAQERELRDWLFAGAGGVDTDLPTELRDHASTLELEYPVQFDIVSVGQSPERSTGALAAATREAMLNAARHAGGDVSVYLEADAAATEVFVRDRGPGFRLEDVPDGRLGVRDSIIGRMLRAGGVASVQPGSGGVGTEIRLRMPRTAPANSSQNLPQTGDLS